MLNLFNVITNAHILFIQRLARSHKKHSRDQPSAQMRSSLCSREQSKPNELIIFLFKMMECLTLK